MASASPAAAPAPVVPAGRVRLLLATLAIVAIAEAIGPIVLPLGSAKLTLLPMLLALLLAAALGIAQGRLPRALRIDVPLQAYAGKLLNAALLLFIVKLGLMAGHSLPQLRQTGWALCFQEFGHAFGTLALGLPLALLLGIKREAVGATFSIGRENNLAIIAEKYGLQSPEGRGVLAEYITGTVLGAVFVTLLAGVVASLDIFDPRSLAMGAGVGSGSLMAAALGVITAGQPPELAKELTAIAAASNLIAGVVGFYLALFLALPACNWLYARLEPVLGRNWLARRAPMASAPTDTHTGVADETPTLGDSSLAWALMALGIVIGNRLSYRVAASDTLAAVAVALAIVAVVVLLKRLLPRLPLMLSLAVLSTLATVPGLWPGAAWVAETTDRLQFMSITTPVLALAGFSVARHLPVFRRLGWRIVVVSLTATAGTFLGAACIAEFFH